MIALDEKKKILADALGAFPRFDHALYRDNFDLVATESQIKVQEIEGERFTTIFLTHYTIPTPWRSDPKFSLDSTARFFKSVTLDRRGELVSVGVPHFFNLDHFRQISEFVEWSRDFRFLEKHDGTCLLVTRWKGKYLIRSRRQVYSVTDSLAGLDFDGYDLGRRLESLFTELGERPVTVITEAIFPHPSLRRFKVNEFYRRVVAGAGFCPYVDYPRQDNFLTAIIDHGSLRFEHQGVLDEIAQRHGLRRPAAIVFDSLEAADKWLKHRQNAEGFCVYFRDGQCVFKFKTRWYRQVMLTTGKLFAALGMGKVNR
jgi:hypothetical protein